MVDNYLFFGLGICYVLVILNEAYRHITIVAKEVTEKHHNVTLLTDDNLILVSEHLDL